MPKQTIKPVVSISIDSLVPFHTNPFGLYTPERLDDMVESVKANGVLVPIIVRPYIGDPDTGYIKEIDGGDFEILSGHNRVEASKIAGLKTIPAVVYDDLSDDDALLISIETNLLQRSYAELSHSERAVILSIHYDAIKKKGRRADLIKEVEDLLSDIDKGQVSTSSLLETRKRSDERIGEDYGLSRSTVARYLRISNLIKPHQNRLDRGIIALYTAVSLSYLTPEEQELVDEVLTAENCKINMAEAEALRHEKRPLTRKAVEQIVKRGDKTSDTPLRLTLKHDFLSRFFSNEQSRDEMEAIIKAALEMYLDTGDGNE